MTDNENLPQDELGQPQQRLEASEMSPNDSSNPQTRLAPEPADGVSSSSSSENSGSTETPEQSRSEASGSVAFVSASIDGLSSQSRDPLGLHSESSASWRAAVPSQVNLSHPQPNMEDDAREALRRQFSDFHRGRSEIFGSGGADESPMIPATDVDEGSGPSNPPNRPINGRTALHEVAEHLAAHHQHFHRHMRGGHEPFILFILDSPRRSAELNKASEHFISRLERVPLIQISDEERECCICYERLEAPPVDFEEQDKCRQAKADAVDAESSHRAPDADSESAQEEKEVDMDHSPARMPCGHVFGMSCLRSWLMAASTCPLCRQRVESRSDTWHRRDESEANSPQIRSPLGPARWLNDLAQQLVPNHRPPPATPDGANVDNLTSTTANSSGPRPNGEEDSSRSTPLAPELRPDTRLRIHPASIVNPAARLRQEQRAEMQRAVRRHMDERMRAREREVQDPTLHQIFRNVGSSLDRALGPPEGVAEDMREIRSGRASSASSSSVAENSSSSADSGPTSSSSSSSSSLRSTGTEPTVPVDSATGEDNEHHERRRREYEAEAMQRIREALMRNVDDRPALLDWLGGNAVEPDGLFDEIAREFSTRLGEHFALHHPGTEQIPFEIAILPPPWLPRPVARAESEGAASAAATAPAAPNPTAENIPDRPAEHLGNHSSPNRSPESQMDVDVEDFEAESTSENPSSSNEEQSNQGPPRRGPIRRQTERSHPYRRQ